MADLVLIDGDLAIFEPTFGAAIVVPLPGTLTGSGPATLGGKPICVEGDEGSVSVPGCLYSTAQYSIPGVGTLSISGLAGDQVATKTRSGGTAVMLKGGQFNAAFAVDAPAMQPVPGSSPVPDATPDYSGSGSFVTTNTHFQAT